MSQQSLQVFYQATAEPNTMRFLVTRPLCEETLVFDDPLKSERSPLAAKLFGFPWCMAVGLSPQAVLVTKQNWVGWDLLADPLAQIISEHLERELPVLLPIPESDNSPNDVQVQTQTTPNPMALKFTVDREIAVETAYFTSREESFRSPLAQKFLEFPWCIGVYVGPDFVTLTKSAEFSWTDLENPSRHLIADYIGSGAPVLHPTNNLESQESDSEDVRVIKHILQTEIRPGVAQDGGEIVFKGLRENVVYVQMLGSCSGCPSSKVTLHQGIESRLKAALPHIQRVVQI